MPMTERETIVRHQPSFRPRTDSQVSAPGGDLPKAESDDQSIPDRKGLLGALLDALHDSRRRQALRVIHQYRHLIAAPRSVTAGAALTAADIFKQPKGNAKMTTSDDAGGSLFNRSTKVQTTNGLTWMLLAICIIGFGILHIAGGAIINGAVKPTAAVPPAALYGD